MMHRDATNAARPPSLVDTLSSGFRTLHTAFPVLLIPIALNAWYWLGPRISLQPLAAWLRSLDPTTWDTTLRPQLGLLLPPDRPFDLRVEAILEGRWLFWFWRRIYPFVPSSNAAQPWEPGTWYVGGFLTLFGAALLLNLVFTLLVVLYLLPLADAVRGTTGGRGWMRRAASAYLRVLGVQGLMLALLIVGGIPLLVVTAVVAQLAQALGLFLGSLVTVLVLWLIFTTSFAFDAVLLHNLNPLRAMLTSLVVVRTSFWGVVGLYLLTAVILGGLGVIWRGLETTIAGMIVAIVGSAYIGAGLAAAHLTFYRNRQPAVAGTST